MPHKENSVFARTRAGWWITVASLCATACTEAGSTADPGNGGAHAERGGYAGSWAGGGQTGGASLAGIGGSGQLASGGVGGVGGVFPGGGALDCGNTSAPQRGLKVRLLASQGVELEGGKVRGWKNQVEGGPDAVQADASRRPELIENVINGRAVVHLDGQDDYLSFEFPVGGKTQMTLAAVSRTWEYQEASPNPDCGDSIGRELNCSGTDQSLLCWAEEGNGFAEQGIFFAVGQREATFRFGTGDAYEHYKTPFVLERANDDRFVFGLALLNNDDRTLYINGEVPRGRVNYATEELVELRARADGGAVRAEPEAWIGKGRFSPATSFWAGDVAELFVYDVALDAAERAAFEDYVACVYFPEGY